MKVETTFEAWSQEWLYRKKPFIKFSTLAAYTNIVINHLIPYWGEKELRDINEEQAQEYVLHLVSSGRLDGRGGHQRPQCKGHPGGIQEHPTRGSKAEDYSAFHIRTTLSGNRI